MTAIERDLPRRVGRRRDSGEYVLPNPSLAPTREAIVDRLVRTVLARAIFPTASHLLHMHDAAQDAPVILAFGTGLIGWQMRHHFRPLLVVEPKQIGAHRSGLPNRLTKPLNPNTIN